MKRAAMPAMLAMVLGWSGLLSAAVVPNADFENGLTGWTPFGGIHAFPVSGAGPDGSACVQLDNASTTDQGIESDLFPIEPEIYDAGYDLSVDILRNGLGDWAAVSVTMAFYDASGGYLGWALPFSGLNGTVGWQTFTHHFDSLPAGTAQGRIKLRLEYGPWYCWFDRVSFGATINQASLQALLDDGGTVTLPKGNFTLTGPIYLRHAGTTLTGSRDSVLCLPAGTRVSTPIVIQSDNCTISGITLLGNSDTVAAGADDAGISGLPGASGCRIRGVTIKNQTGNAIRMNGVANARIEGCTFDTFLGSGVCLAPDNTSTKSCSGIVVSGCQFQTTQMTANPCIAIMDGSALGNDNITITSNICRAGGADSGISVSGSSTVYHTSIVIANNVIDNATNAGILLRRVIGGVITANRITDCGSATLGQGGILATGDTSLCQGLTIGNNSISVRPSTGPGIYIKNYERVVIANNSVDNATNGLWLDSDGGNQFRYCTLQGNTVTNSPVGIKVGGSSNANGFQNVQIQGNSIRTCSSGIRCTGSSTTSRPKFIIVLNNQIEDCTGSGNGIYFNYVQKSRINYNYFMNSTAVSILNCSDVTQTGNTFFTP